MTQDEIIRMAREAGLPPTEWVFNFAALVAAHEREKQAEQEPVAWVDEDGFPWKYNLDGKDWVPLYAAPVRTKDLTDDEIADIRMSIVAYEPVEWGRVFARAVIAAYKEKNRG